MRLHAFYDLVISGRIEIPFFRLSIAVHIFFFSFHISPVDNLLHNGAVVQCMWIWEDDFQHRGLLGLLFQDHFLATGIRFWILEHVSCEGTNCLRLQQMSVYLTFSCIFLFVTKRGQMNIWVYRDYSFDALLSFSSNSENNKNNINFAVPQNQSSRKNIVHKSLKAKNKYIQQRDYYKPIPHIHTNTRALCLASIAQFLFSIRELCSWLCCLIVKTAEFLLQPPNCYATQEALV